MTVAPTSSHGRPAPRRHRPAAFAGFLMLAVLVAVGVVLLVRHDVFQSSSGSSVEGSGIAATQTRDLAPFRSVDLAGSNDVSIAVGGQQSVVVRGDHNLLRRVTTRVEGGGLVIGTTPGSFTTKSPMRVDITVPSIEALTLSGSGIVSVTGLRTPSLTVTLPGSGVLRASGTAGKLDVTLAGSGDAQLDGLVARDVHAVLSGSGRILVTPTRSLGAWVPGSGAIVYGGSPERVTTSVTGSGAVTRG